MRAWYLISYDIRDEKRLRKVAKKLEGYGTRMQYSLFRCQLSPRGLERLKWELAQITEKEDSLLVISLCQSCTGKLRMQNPKTDWPDENQAFTIL